jgi:enoyl-CoA hydratase
MSELVKTERHGRVLVVTLTREEKRNALNPDITAGLDAAMNTLEDDADLWCGVLTGGRRYFSAGADLTIGPGAPTPRGGLVGLITRDRSTPLIAAVEGFAVGGGLELVLSCDLVVAARDAVFALPEVKRGLMADFGGAFRIARALPPYVAREMLLTGRDLPAERAERLGLVNRLAEPGEALAVALELAAEICSRAPLAVSASLRVSNAITRGDETALWELSDAEHQKLVGTQDVAEGLTAFFERRPPTWTGH